MKLPEFDVPSGYLYFEDKYHNGIATSPSEKTQYECLNKMYGKFDNNGEFHLTIDNVASMKNLLFEIDDLPISDQLLYLDIRTPAFYIINRAVFSGGKSIHFRVSLNKEPENEEHYKFIWNFINNKYFNGAADTQCSNPNRLTRCPGAFRDDETHKHIYQRDLTKRDMVDHIFDINECKSEWDNEKKNNLFQVAARKMISQQRIATKRRKHYPIKSLKLPAVIDFIENGTMEHQHHNKALKAIYAIKQNMQDEYTDDEIIDFIMEYGSIKIGEVKTILRSIR